MTTGCMKFIKLHRKYSQKISRDLVVFVWGYMEL